MGERDLADGGRRLAFLQLERPHGQLEDAPAERDGARGDDDDVGAARPELGRDRRQRAQPFGLEGAGFGLDQQGRADLDGEPPGRGISAARSFQPRSWMPAPLLGPGVLALGLALREWRPTAAPPPVHPLSGDRRDDQRRNGRSRW
jgi:hypothetical protein